MPTVYRWGPYRAYFVTHDCREPPHVHVDRGDSTAKVWLQPLSLAGLVGFPDHELRRIVRELDEHRGVLLEAWDEHCRKARS